MTINLFNLLFIIRNFWFTFGYIFTFELINRVINGQMIGKNGQIVWKMILYDKRRQ